MSFDQSTAVTPSRSFFMQLERRSRCFFCILQLLTVIFHGSPSVIKLISLLPAFMHVNNNVYLYDIIDDTSAM